MKDLNVLTNEDLGKKTKCIYDNILQRLEEVSDNLSEMCYLSGVPYKLPRFEECFQKNTFSLFENDAINSMLSPNKRFYNESSVLKLVSKTNGLKQKDWQMQKEGMLENKISALKMLAVELVQESEPISPKAISNFFLHGYTWNSLAELIGMAIMNAIENYKFNIINEGLELAS